MGSQTTQKTTIPDPSPEELKQIALGNAAMEAALQSFGYSFDTTETQAYDNPLKVESLEAQLSDYQSTLEGLDQQMKDVGRNSTQFNDLQQQKNQLKSKIRQTTSKLADEQDKVSTKIDGVLIKREDPRVQDLIDKGQTGKANKLREEIKKKEFEALGVQEDINKLFLDNTRKFLSGDLSITAQQQEELNESTARVRDPINKLLDEVGQQIGQTDEAVGSALDNVVNQINQTGLDVEEALVEAESRVQETGVSMSEALDQTIATSRDLAERNLFKQTRDLRSNLATMSTSLGRASTDPGFIRELENRTQESLQDVELNLAVQSAQGRLGIAERTGSGLENISLLRTQLTGEKGLRLEDVARTRAQLAEATGGKKEQLSQARTSLSESLLREQEQRRTALGQGLPIQQAQVGISTGQFTSGQNQLATQNLFQTGQFAQQSRGQLLQERMAQPTTTTTTGGLGTTLGGIFGGIGTAASGVGSIFGGIGALKPKQSLFG